MMARRKSAPRVWHRTAFRCLRFNFRKFTLLLITNSAPESWIYRQFMEAGNQRMGEFVDEHQVFGSDAWVRLK